MNLGNSTGDERTIIEWTQKVLLEAAEAALGDNRASWDDLIGHMFFSEYQRWSEGTMTHLYKRDKEEFKVQFGKHIESIRQNQPVEYLFGLLRNFLKGRKQIPCLIFDNADHFSIGFQERVFQFARSLFEHELCIVIMPVTDKTSWQLSQDGALNSFENEALLLPTPPARQVLERRISFVLKKIEDERAQERGTYFVGRGIRVDVANLIKFVRGLEEIFLNSDRTVYVLGHLANHNVRNVLELSRDVINSPHVGLTEAFKAYVLGSAVHIPDFKIRKALIRGRYDIFIQRANSYVQNIFALSGELRTSPLIGLRVLQILHDVSVGYGKETRYVDKADLYSYMLGMGFERQAIGLCLGALLKTTLVINYDPTCTSEETATRLEISPAGDQHWFWARGNYDYVEALAEVTPILDEAAFKEIETAAHSGGPQRMRQLIRAFVRYLESEDQIFCQVPDHDSYQGQRNLLERLR